MAVRAPPKQEGQMPSQFDAERPRKPHLAIPNPSSPGRLHPIEEGHTLLIIEDPTSIEGIFPLKVVSVSHSKLRFKCHCSNPHCTRTVEAKLKWTGVHPPQFK